VIKPNRLNPLIQADYYYLYSQVYTRFQTRVLISSHNANQLPETWLFCDVFQIIAAFALGWRMPQL
jgi:hypothetical protein